MEQSTLDHSLVLAIGGELDHHRALALTAELKDQIDCFLPKRLVLDLAQLSFSDSSGIALLLRLHRAMAQVDGHLELINIQPQPKRLFETAGLCKLISAN